MLVNTGMYGDLKSTAAWAIVALVAGANVGGATTAVAADLGGNCCADLEERIAELEATTARKGNRKVSLEISGHVNESIIFWDDGEESNAYIVTNDNARTRFRFKGKAKINSDLEAGYLLEVGVRSANSKRFTQLNDEGNDQAIDVGPDLRDSAWYLKSKTFGTGWVGQTSSATDGITEVNLTQTKDFAKYSDVEDTGLGLLLRAKGGGLATSSIGATGESGVTWRRLIGDGGDQPGDGEKRFNVVRYDTPEFAGFTGSGAWGEDDYWDVGLRYAGEHAGFQIAAGIGYGRLNDKDKASAGEERSTTCAASITVAGLASQECEQFGGSVSLIHKETGLFANVAGGIKKDELLDQTTLGQAGADDEQTFWAIQAGIEKKFNSFGKTTIFGEYYDYDGGGNTKRNGTLEAADNNPLNPSAFNAQIFATEVNVYGVGIAQGFDAAALTLYLNYRHVEGDLTLRQSNGVIVDSPLEDLDLVQAGGIIKF